MEHCLEKVDVTDPASVENWHERFNFYIKTNDKITDPKDKDKVVPYYLTMIGKEAYDLLKDLAYPDKLETKSVNDLKKLLMGHLQPIHFEATERACFHNLIRRGEETLRSFLLRLQHQAAKCNFGAQLKDQLRDRIVAGINDPEIQKRLLRETPLTFDKAKATLETHDDVNTALAGQLHV